MLTRSQLHTLLILRNREDTLFSSLPVELIREISEFGQDPNSEFTTALKYVARGELEQAKAMLDQYPRLVMQSGTVVTRAGLTVCHKTPLEVALGEGDPEMVAMILPYFSRFEGGEKEKERQLERYRPLIKRMLKQQPYDIPKLIAIIKDSSAVDVTAALNKDMDHHSELRGALIEFRKGVSPGIVKKPQMHYNYQTLIQAYRVFSHEWDNLYRASGNNYNKCDLVWKQVIGYLQRSLPAVDRFTFARGLCDFLVNEMPLERKTDYKSSVGLLADSSPTDSSFTGLGFDIAISITGCPWQSVARGDSRGCRNLTTKLMSNKMADLQNLCGNTQTEDERMGNRLKQSG